MNVGQRISLFTLQRLSDLHASTVSDAEKLQTAASITDDLVHRLIADEKKGEHKPKMPPVKG